MVKRNKLRNVRRKALFGADGAEMAAATLAAAGITSAATMAAAGIGAAASASQAKEQAKSIEDNAVKRAEAIKLQNENNNALQEKNIEFIRSENEKTRQQQQDIQTTLQLMAGQENSNTRKDMANIKLRNGGKISKYSLRGRNGNLPFTVTDGGAVLPIATTPEGYDLYEILGNDHEHYHKTQGGKSKTGVGIRFAGKKTIEGEGNQNTNQGELMLVTPTDAKFISKHSIKGFNPAKAVLNGVHPIDAFDTQELIKDMYGISDDGNSSPVRGMKAYNGRSLRCGGRCKKPGGGGLSTYYDVYGIPYNESYIPTAPTGGVNPPVSGGNNYTAGAKPKATRNGNLTGAWLGAAGNLGGAIISGIGNTIASNTLASAYNRAGGILADAYGRLRGIDTSLLNRDDYRAAHAMAALQAPIVNTGAERSAAERTLHRNLARINRNTLSSAAAQDRSARAEVDYNDRISQIEANADKIRQSIIQGNMERITQVSNENANRDTQANQQFANAYLTLLQYNNDIENEKISGKAQAYADSLTQTAGTRASLAQANAASWAGALTGSASGFNNTLSAMAKQKSELEMAKLGATPDSLYDYYLSHPNDPGLEAFASKYQGKGGKYTNWYDNLMRAKNNQ